jgi:hypothetical protein
LNYMTQVALINADKEVVQIAAQTIHFYLVDHGAVLATRPRGKETADHLRTLAAEPGDLILDFRDVEVASAPFLQELVNGIQSVIAAASETGRIVLIANMNEDVAETLAYVVARKRLMLPYRQGNQVELLEANQQFVDTLREAQRLRSFTAPQLAGRLHIKPDAATQRLRKLLATGSVVREPDATAKQGVRHVYRAATAELAEQTDRELVSA